MSASKPQNIQPPNPPEAAASPREALTGAAASSPVSDAFADLNRLRLPQDFAATANVKTVITTISVRKPGRHEFIRVRPGSEWRFLTNLFQDKNKDESYLVEPAIQATIPTELQPTVLVLAIARDSGVPFLWPCPLPGTDGRTNRWHESRIAAAALAEERWIRVVADMTSGSYVPEVAQGQLPDPVWPADLGMADYLRLAYRDRLISDLSHPVLRRLRGET